MYKYLLLLAFLAGNIAECQVQCPVWSLPWGDYSGILNANHVCLYSDVRYGLPPVGTLRFQAPQFPPDRKGPVAPGHNMSCHQVVTDQGVGKVLLPPKSGAGEPEPFGTQDEDCLFLDVYIPPEAFSPTQIGKPIPVVNWFYGGAYFFGSKTFFNTSEIPFYSGDGFVNTASKNEPIIFVAGNYRLGAFGWLAGSQIKKQGQPNAGLLDQRLILRFIHKYLPSINSTHPLKLGPVSVWGESAGASSIYHHLAMPLNIKEPLFQRALLQSPAYQWLWNQSVMDETYTGFAEQVTSKLSNPCTKSIDVKCLQQASIEDLKTANQGLFNQYLTDGFFPVGPSVDGNLIPALAPVRFEQKSTVMKLDTIMVSHVEKEIQPVYDETASSFIPRKIRAAPHDEGVFEDFVRSVFHVEQIVNEILQRYPSADYKGDQVLRAVSVITDSSFTCNTRFIIERYVNDLVDKVYAMNYAVFSGDGAAVHGSDILPSFANKHINYTEFIPNRLHIPGEAWYANEILTQVIAPRMQSFFTSNAISTDPNQMIPHGEAHWLRAFIDKCPKSTDGTCVWNVMKPTAKWLDGSFKDNNGADEQTSSDRCNFWRSLADKLTPPLRHGGYGDNVADSHEQVVIKVSEEL